MVVDVVVECCGQDGIQLVKVSGERLAPAPTHRISECVEKQIKRGTGRSLSRTRVMFDMRINTAKKRTYTVSIW